MDTARVELGLLSGPAHAAILSVNTDVISAIIGPDWPDDGTPGQFCAKAWLSGLLPAPHTEDDHSFVLDHSSARRSLRVCVLFLC